MEDIYKAFNHAQKMRRRAKSEDFLIDPAITYFTCKKLSEICGIVHVAVCHDIEAGNLPAVRSTTNRGKWLIRPDHAKLYIELKNMASAGRKARRKKVDVPK